MITCDLCGEQKDEVDCKLVTMIKWRRFDKEHSKRIKMACRECRRKYNHQYRLAKTGEKCLWSNMKELNKKEVIIDGRARRP